MPLQRQFRAMVKHRRIAEWVAGFARYNCLVSSWGTSDSGDFSSWSPNTFGAASRILFALVVALGSALGVCGGSSLGGSTECQLSPGFVDEFIGVTINGLGG